MSLMPSRRQSGGRWICMLRPRGAIIRSWCGFTAADGGKASDGKALFGDDASQRDLSPITYVGKVKSIPAFLILHVADRPDSKAQSEHFAKALQTGGVSATVVPAEGKTHGTINSEL